MAIKIQTMMQWNVGFWWTWAHSDWIQVLYELGIIGLICYLAMFLFALRAAYINNQYVFQALVIYSITSLANFPAHFGGHAFIGVAIVALSFMDKKTQSSELDFI